MATFSARMQIFGMENECLGYWNAILNALTEDQAQNVLCIRMYTDYAIKYLVYQPARLDKPLL